MKRSKIIRNKIVATFLLGASLAGLSACASGAGSQKYQFSDLGSFQHYPMQKKFDCKIDCRNILLDFNIEKSGSEKDGTPFGKILHVHLFTMNGQPAPIQDLEVKNYSEAVMFFLEDNQFWNSEPFIISVPVGVSFLVTPNIDEKTGKIKISVSGSLTILKKVVTRTIHSPGSRTGVMLLQSPMRTKTITMDKDFFLADDTRKIVHPPGEKTEAVVLQSPVIETPVKIVGKEFLLADSTSPTTIYKKDGYSVTLSASVVPKPKY